MPPADARQALGRRGEALAAAYLQAHGCRLVTANWRPGAGGRGEIDLVVYDGPALVIVEVRTRRGGPVGLAEESVDRGKQQRLIALALAYLQAASLPEATDWRIDVVTVHLVDGRPPIVTWLRGAVEEG